MPVSKYVYRLQEIRLKTYFANCGQKELFSPLPQRPDAAEQSTDVPIFRDFDEDALVRLLSTSGDMHQRCFEFCLKFVQQNQVDISILRNPSGSSSKARLMVSLYSRLQNFPKASEWMKSVSKDSPDYAGCVNAQGVYHLDKAEFEESIECFQSALAHSQSPNLAFHSNLAMALFQSEQYEKARVKLEETIQLHDKIYGEGSETIILSRLMLYLGILFYELEELRSAITTLQRVEQMQKRITRSSDIDLIYLNLYLAMSLSRLCQNDQSLDYLDRALRLSHKIIGEHNLSYELPKIYFRVAIVYRHCDLNDEALSWLKRNLQLLGSMYGDTPNPGKVAIT